MRRIDFARTAVAVSLACLSFIPVSGCQSRHVTDARSRILGGGQAGSGQEAVAPAGAESGAVKGGQVLVEGGVRHKPEICAALDKPCEGAGSASYCSIGEISGARLNEPYRLFAHAKSECEARKAVLADACKRGIDIKSLDAISCGADKSEGKCPLESGMCITLYDPSRCVAARYADAQINSDSAIAGWGSNSCVARMEMRRSACSRNINPDKLSDVQCERIANFQGDCPPVQPSCDLADKAPATCEGTVPGMAGKLTTSAAGACLARFNLEWKLCLAGQSPAALVNSIKCDQSR